MGWVYEKPVKAYCQLQFGNDVGYLPDGTAMNKAGNDINHPGSLRPDPHKEGSALPKAVFVNEVGYLPDGTAMNLAGNAVNHPETIGPDPHTVGAALLPPLKGFVNEIGYCPDGTDMKKTGNLYYNSK
mmetsp:Transcript_54871/g.178252  ORF Transcript_54871/g.178252 Transcript_54871/m.178252 type:complete len:128 (-) Transcript_54871:63-446(-)